MQTSVGCSKLSTLGSGHDLCVALKEREDEDDDGDGRREREREGGMKIITGRGPRRCFATTSDRIHQEFASEIWLALAPGTQLNTL